MSLGEWIAIIAVLTLSGWALLYKEEQRATTAYEASALPPPYHPQGLLWIDEEMEQSTWWGDGAIIQSTH